MGTQIPPVTTAHVHTIVSFVGCQILKPPQLKRHRSTSRVECQRLDRLQKREIGGPY